MKKHVAIVKRLRLSGKRKKVGFIYLRTLLRHENMAEDLGASVLQGWPTRITTALPIIRQQI